MQSPDTIRQNRPPIHVVVVSMIRKYVIVTARPQELEYRCKVPVASRIIARPQRHKSPCKAPVAEAELKKLT